MPKWGEYKGLVCTEPDREREMMGCSDESEPSTSMVILGIFIASLGSASLADPESAVAFARVFSEMGVPGSTMTEEGRSENARLAAAESGLIIRWMVSPVCMASYSFKSLLSASAFPLYTKRCASTGGAELFDSQSSFFSSLIVELGEQAIENVSGGFSDLMVILIGSVGKNK